MKYNHIWMIEVSRNKKYWAVTGGTWFRIRKEAESFIRREGWGKTVNKDLFYRVSKYMGPITSGCIKEI